MKITKERLQELYMTLPNKEVAKKLGVSVSTLLTYVQSAGIPMKGKGNRNRPRKVKIV